MKDTEKMIELEKMLELEKISPEQKKSLKNIIVNSVYGSLKHLERVKNERYWTNDWTWKHSKRTPR